MSETARREAATAFKECEACHGAGQIPVGENRVTLGMAIDAGDRSLEGAFHSYAYEPCDECEGTGVQPSGPSPEAPPTRDWRTP